ncbi:uncharacterized protein LOC8062773 [Sorghum bicolor]|uniref:uncharacterized protein LOC8062773 n=1 Tax=Sorghum bicolor TaxID=4558 RepID=UPI000B42469B|nr:uncharacterized protein LOC8062773 [Sorghum bicolor]|eukprot:XP_002460317.2 uncharacterized protein LOC8062773 [Sorghum bicolor]
MSKQTKLAWSCSRFPATAYSYFNMSQSKQQKVLLFLGPERTFNPDAMHNMDSRPRGAISGAKDKRERTGSRQPFARLRQCSSSPLDELLPAGELHPRPASVAPPLLVPCSSPTRRSSSSPARRLEAARLRRRTPPHRPPEASKPAESESECACMMNLMSSTENGTEGSNVLKRNSDDVGWEYGVLVDANNKDKPEHHRLRRLKRSAKKALADAKRKREEKSVRELEIREEVHVSRVGADSDEVTCVRSSEPHKLGSIDKWTRAIDPKATMCDSLKQQQLNKELWKERTNQVHKYIAKWAYTHAIAFNALDNDEFKQMCEAIGQFGPGFVPPTQDALRGKLLEEEYERTKSLLQEREAEKMKNGCSIMTDVWSDRKRRSIMNVCTNCAEGTSFISSKEMSDVSHTSELIFELVDKAIEEIGPDNVVQVVTDNASNNMGAKRLLEEKRPHIFWTSCAAHTINLMLQGIGNMPRFKKVVDQAKAFTIFAYGHTRTLECLRCFTEGKEVVRRGVTRFASNFLTLASMQEKKDQLRKMVVHSKWDTLKDVKSKKGKEATATILSPSFWRDVKLTLAVFEPLVKVLRLVDGDLGSRM